MKKTALSVVVSVAASLAFSWNIVPVDTAGTAARGWWNSMAISGSTISVGYIVYVSGTPLQTAIRYARSTDYGANWTVETVDTASNYGTGYATLGWFRGGLDLDPDGNPHMAYTVEASIGSFCMHAKRTAPGTWKLDTIEMRTSQPLVCHDADIKIDPQGRAHVVYTYYGVKTRYAVKDTSGWTIHDVSLDPAYGVALALDSARNPHVAIGTLSDVRYAWSTDHGANWQTEVVDNGWWHVDLCLDAVGQPLIAYTHLNAAIWFGRRTGPNNWATGQVDIGGGNCCRPCVFYDAPGGEIHVGYYPTMSSPDIKRAVSSNGGGSWSLETVSGTGGVYASSSCPDLAKTADGTFLVFESPGYELSMAIDRTVGCPEPVAGQELELRIAPNPASRVARIELGGMALVSGLVSVFDRAGKLVATSALQGGESRVDVRGLRNGVYFCRIGGRDGPVGAKLLVQH